jgi:3'(2'), 5'-bisphosphate nucleotidase
MTQKIIENSFVDKLISFGESLSKEIVDIQNSDFEVNQKEDDSPLTKADLHSNSRIKSFLKENHSLSNILSEEDKSVDFDLRKKWEYYWVIDPIDGTKEFVKGREDYCVNIALCRGSDPIFGYVLVPKSKDYYLGGEDFNAEKNGSPIKCGKVSSSSKMRIVASNSHINEATQSYIDDVKKDFEVEVLKVGSSLKFCLIAENKADIYPRIGPTMEWDTCAPHAILNSAGGDVSEYLSPSSLKYNKEDLLNPSFVASGFSVFPTVI